MKNRDFTSLLKKAAQTEIWDGSGTSKVTLGYALTWGYNRQKSEKPELLADIEWEIDYRTSQEIPFTEAQNELMNS